MQLKKLAVLCNACFWLTLVFQVWKHARDLHQVVLNTVVVLGILAVLVNLSWMTMDVIKKRGDQKKITGGEMNNGGKRRNTRLFNAFNLFSFIAQIILLGIKLL